MAPSRARVVGCTSDRASSTRSPGEDRGLGCVLRRDFVKPVATRKRHDCSPSDDETASQRIEGAVQRPGLPRTPRWREAIIRVGHGQLWPRAKVARVRQAILAIDSAPGFMRPGLPSDVAENRSRARRERGVRERGCHQRTVGLERRTPRRSVASLVAPSSPSICCAPGSIAGPRFRCITACQELIAAGAGRPPSRS
jgi:hypothetical protein